MFNLNYYGYVIYVNFIYGNLLLENYDVYKIFIKGIIFDKYFYKAPF